MKGKEMKIKIKTIIIIFVVIFVFYLGINLFNNWNSERKTILNCTRENGDKLYLKFNDFGIIEMKLNGISITGDDLVEYQSNFTDEFHFNRYSHLDKSNTYIIYSDSSYAVNIINDWIFTWVKNNWINSKGNQVENLDLILNLYKYVTINFFNCQVKKCTAHVGEVGNELADALATNNQSKYNKLKKEHFDIL